MKSLQRSKNQLQTFSIGLGVTTIVIQRLYRIPTSRAIQKQKWSSDGLGASPLTWQERVCYNTRSRKPISLVAATGYHNVCLGVPLHFNWVADIYESCRRYQTSTSRAIRRLRTGATTEILVSFLTRDGSRSSQTRSWGRPHTWSKDTFLEVQSLRYS